jgi:hypothetical protein
VILVLFIILAGTIVGFSVSEIEQDHGGVDCSGADFERRQRRAQRAFRRQLRRLRNGGRGAR